MRIAIVGTGVSGLVCAHLLSRRHDVTVFEADRRPGGHAHTVRIDLPDETHEVDTGFLVYNERNYPGLVRLFDTLGVATKPSDMSFGVSDDVSGVEWRGTSLSTMFAQRRNALRPAFLRMLTDVVRFNRAARALLPEEHPTDRSLADLLADGRWSSQFVDWYLVPMGSSIWSADPGTLLDMPAVTFARFFDNHGLLDHGNQPSWRTVDGGSRRYVEAIVSPLGDAVRLCSPVAKVTRRRRRSGAPLATRARSGSTTWSWPPTATRPCDCCPTPPGSSATSLVPSGTSPTGPPSTPTSDSCPPTAGPGPAGTTTGWPTSPERATLTYRLRSLQGIDSAHEILITLNRDDAIREDRVLARFDYAHPVFDAAAIAAQRRHEELNGPRRTWFCGAYWGYGFHEDGVQSALTVCRRLAGEDL